MAADVHTSGQVLEKTTRTRVITESESPDFWPYLESQSRNLPDAKHVLYLYLCRDNKRIPYGVYQSHFPDRAGRLVPIWDQEAFEQAVQSRFGGGNWNMILKIGNQRKTEARMYTGDGPTNPPPAPGDMEHSPTVQKTFIQQTPSDTTAAIASQAIETIAGQEHRAISLGLDMVRTAADTVKQYAERNNQPMPANAEVAALENEFRRAIIQRIQQDPMQQFTAMLAAVREVNTALTGGGGGNGSDMDRLRSVVAFARELGLGASAATSGGAEIVRTVANIIPGAVDSFRATMEAWSAGKQAERDSLILMQNGPARPAIPLPPVPQQRSPFTPQPTPQPAPVVTAPQPTSQVGSIIPPSTEFIEQRIVEMLRAPVSAEDAAHNTLDFLHTLDGANPQISLVTVLAQQGETGLVNTFHARPVLKPATADMVRLLEFIRAFLRLHAEDLAEEQSKNKPN